MRLVAVHVDVHFPVNQARFVGGGLLTVAVTVVVNLTGYGVVGGGVALHAKVVVRERGATADSHQVETGLRCRHRPALLGNQPYCL